MITEYYITTLVSVAIYALADLRSKYFSLFTVFVCQAEVIMILTSAHEVNVISTRPFYLAHAEEGSFVRHGTLCVYIDLFYLDGFRAGRF